MATRMLSPEDLKAAKPILTTALVLSGILSGMLIVAGVVAIVLQARSPTNFSWWGITMSTGDVGVALAALGAVSAVLVIRKAFKVITELAKIPSSKGQA